MIELLIALFAVLLLSVGFFIRLKGSTAFVLNRESISAEQASRNQRLFQRSGLLYILLGVLCLVSQSFQNTFFVRSFVGAGDGLYGLLQHPACSCFKGTEQLTRISFLFIVFAQFLKR